MFFGPSSHHHNPGEDTIIATNSGRRSTGVLRRIARKVLRRSAPPERLSLTLEHTGTEVILRGAVADGILVEELQTKLQGAVPSVVVTTAQKPSSTFEFRLDLAALHDRMGAAAGAYD